MLVLIAFGILLTGRTSEAAAKQEARSRKMGLAIGLVLFFGLMQAISATSQFRVGESTLEKVGRAWEAVVGEATAARTRVVDFSGGVLTLEIASSTLKHDLLTLRKKQLLEGLKERLPDVQVRNLNPVGEGTAEVIGRLLLGDYIIPFEFASILLLVALVGAAYLVRRPKA